MVKKYYIMLYSQLGHNATPITKANGEVAFYSTRKDAKNIAKNHAFCKAFGYKIFSMEFRI